MTKLQSLLQQYRTFSKTEREKGTYFEKLILCYLQNEPSYADLYSEWASPPGPLSCRAERGWKPAELAVPNE